MKIFYPVATGILLSVGAFAAEPVTICGVEWLPFTKVEGQNITGGISYEIHKEIFKRLNIDFSFKNVPWSRCLNGVADGSYTAISDSSGGEQNLITGPSPISFYPVGLYTRPDTQKNTYNIAELSDVKVGVVQDYFSPSQFPKGVKWKLDASPDEETALKKLHAKRYDYYIADIIGTDALAKKLNIEVVKLEPLLFKEKLYLAFGRKHQKLAEDYYVQFEKLKNEGFINKLYTESLSKTYDEMAK